MNITRRALAGFVALLAVPTVAAARQARKTLHLNLDEKIYGPADFDDCIQTVARNNDGSFTVGGKSNGKWVELRVPMKGADNLATILKDWTQVMPGEIRG